MCSRFVCLLFYILVTSKVILGHIPTCDSAHSWWLYSAASLEHHDLLSHSVTLFWNWTNQSLPYPNNAEHQARKPQVPILKSGLTRPGFKPASYGLEPAIFRFPDLPKQEVGALLIWPSQLVHSWWPYSATHWIPGLHHHCHVVTLSGHWPNSPCPILMMLSHWFDLTRVRTCG